MATKTLAKLISDWELLNTALQPHLTDMPFLKDKATELEGLIAEAKGMDTRQQDLRGTLQETVRQRRELERIVRLAEIAGVTGGDEVRRIIGTTVRPCHDVVDVQDRAILRAPAAVDAPESVSLEDRPAEARGQASRHGLIVPWNTAALPSVLPCCSGIE